MIQKLLSALDLGGPGDLRSDLRGHPRPSEAEVLPEGLDVFLGVLGGHVDGVWRAKRAAGGAASEASLPPEASQVAAEGSGLRVTYIFVGIKKGIFY